MALTWVKGIGPASIKSLVAYAGSPSQVFRLKERELLKVPGIGRAYAKSILSFNDWEAVEKEYKFTQKHNISVLPYYSKAYPSRLKELVDAPALLYVKGVSDLNSPRMLAVVGSRKATQYGKDMTRKLIEELAPYAPVIVSGLAYGIDIEAHKAALESGLDTIGVVAHGLDKIYPAQHRKYAAEMVKKGSLVTEFRSNTQIVKELFPSRNRIVAGMIDGLVVVETTKKGGALITADIAFSYNRDVLAVPGRTVDEMSAGCNQLIRNQKAHLIESASDVAWILGWPEPTEGETKSEVVSQLNTVESRIYEVLKQTPVDGMGFNALREQLSLTSSDLSLHLLNMEFNGYVISLPGNHFKIK